MRTPARRCFGMWFFLCIVHPVVDASATRGPAAVAFEEYEPFEVSVHLQVDRSVASSRIAADLKNEAETVWRPYGVRLAWTDGGAAEAPACDLSLEAILEGRIDEPDPPKGTAVLGRAYIDLLAPGIQPIRVSLRATEAILAFRERGRSSATRIVRDRDLARALGRVLAHEIGHVLLGMPSHNEAGLMRAVFRADELTEPSRVPFSLACSDLGRLQSRIRLLAGAERGPIDRRLCIPGRSGR